MHLVLGEGRTIVKDGLTQPISLNIYETYIYWYDLQERVIRRINKNTSIVADEAIIQSDINDIINLLVFHGSRQQGMYGH